MTSSFSIEIYGSRVLRLGGKLLCFVDENHELLFTHKSTDPILFADEHWILLPSRLMSVTSEEFFELKEPISDPVLDINDTAILLPTKAINFRTQVTRKLRPGWKRLAVHDFAVVSDTETMDLSTMTTRLIPRVSPPELKETHQILNARGDTLVTVESSLRTQHLLFTEGKTEVLSHPPTKVSHKGIRVGPHVYKHKDGKWSTEVVPVEKERAWKAADQSQFVRVIDHSGKASRWCIMNTWLV